MTDENAVRLAGRIDALNEIMDVMNALDPDIEGLSDLDALALVNQRWGALLAHIKTMGDEASSQVSDLRRGVGTPDKMN